MTEKEKRKWLKKESFRMMLPKEIRYASPREIVHHFDKGKDKALVYMLIKRGLLLEEFVDSHFVHEREFLYALVDYGVRLDIVREQAKTNKLLKYYLYRKGYDLEELSASNWDKYEEDLLQAIVNHVDWEEFITKAEPSLEEESYLMMDFVYAKPEKANERWELALQTHKENFVFQMKFFASEPSLLEPILHPELYCYEEENEDGEMYLELGDCFYNLFFENIVKFLKNEKNKEEWFSKIELFLNQFLAEDFPLSFDGKEYIRECMRRIGIVQPEDYLSKDSSIIQVFLKNAPYPTYKAELEQLCLEEKDEHGVLVKRGLFKEHWEAIYLPRALTDDNPTLIKALLQYPAFKKYEPDFFETNKDELKLYFIEQGVGLDILKWDSSRRVKQKLISSGYDLPFFQQRGEMGSVLSRTIYPNDSVLYEYATMTQAEEEIMELVGKIFEEVEKKDWFNVDFQFHFFTKLTDYNEALWDQIVKEIPSTWLA